MSDERTPLGVLLWFGWALVLLAISGITVALQRKRIAWRMAVLISFLPVPILAGLPPALLGFSREAASGWYTLFIPVGAVISAVLVGLLLRRSARAYFSED